MRKLLAKKIGIFLIIFALTFCAAAQQLSVDFYGIVSPDADSSMTSMTGDLYFAQLSDMNSIHVADRRASNFVSNYLEKGKPEFEGNDTSFYAIIKRGSSSGTWDCTLYLATPGTGNTISYSREFDSYYKIMTDAKQTIAALFDRRNSPDAPSSNAQQQVSTQQPASVQHVSTDIIAGTWDGDEYIDRIVILRGGRGFIIFKNGASMSVSVEVAEKSSTVKITQVGKSNASYFPELPRQNALTLATSAGPLSWTLSLTNSDTLAGTKNTFTTSGGNQAAPKTERVTWTRR